MIQNPFTPTFDVPPNIYAGRNDYLREFVKSIRGGVGHPGRAAVIKGIRGTGKTSFAYECMNIAKRNGWFTIKETARDGLIDRLINNRFPKLIDELPKHISQDPFKMKKLKLSIKNIEFELEKTKQFTSLEDQLAIICSQLKKYETGLYIFIDEITANSLKELAEVADTIKYLFSENQDIIIHFAGLPRNISALQDMPGSTFLYRAANIELTNLSEKDSKAFFKDTFGLADTVVSEELLSFLYETTRGFPFYMQLLGFEILEELQNKSIVDIGTVVKVLPRVKEQIKTKVISPDTRNLNENEQKIFTELLHSKKPIKLGILASKIGKTSSTDISRDRESLLKMGLVQAPKYGYLELEPNLKQILETIES